MMLNSFAISALTLTVLPFVPASFTQAIPATAIAASPWEPVARISPQKPFRVEIINQTGINLDYSSTTNEFPPRTVASGAKTSVQQLPLPVYLLISPANPRFNLKYFVTTKDNVVTIKVLQGPDPTPGNTTVNIQETGGIFVY